MIRNKINIDESWADLVDVVRILQPTFIIKACRVDFDSEPLNKL